MNDSLNYFLSQFIGLIGVFTVMGTFYESSFIQGRIVDGKKKASGWSKMEDGKVFENGKDDGTNDIVSNGVDVKNGDDCVAKYGSKNADNQTSENKFWNGFIKFILCFSEFTNAKKILSLGKKQGQHL